MSSGGIPEGSLRHEFLHNRYADRASKPARPTHLMVMVSRNARPTVFCSTSRRLFLGFLRSARTPPPAFLFLPINLSKSTQRADTRRRGNCLTLDEPNGFPPDHSGRSPACFENLSPRRDAMHDSASPMGGINRNPPALSTHFQKNFTKPEMWPPSRLTGARSSPPR